MFYRIHKVMAVLLQVASRKDCLEVPALLVVHLLGEPSEKKKPPSFSQSCWYIITT